jgi:hypothetical protein
LAGLFYKLTLKLPFTSASVSYERIQSTNNKAHSDGIEGVIQWKF